MSLTPGFRFGSYEIVAQLGVGGMGEVYRARDTQLKRDVAIKILPSDVTADADRLSRFQREAEILASLNHANIAHVFGIAEADGVRGIVMELAEGRTLAQMLIRGALPIDEALGIARQIAEALETAHDRGVVHRDLKPANVMLTPDGVVKVLDFGLAKALNAGPEANIDAATFTSPAMTRAGIILGTAAYMSPEQARGRAVDARTDIWAFGCVLFEMLSGRQPFDGETITDILGAIVHKEPEWSLVPATVPESLRRLLERCLAKDQKQRLRNIADVRLEIQDLLARPRSTVSGGGQASLSRKSRAIQLVGLISAVLVGVALASGYWSMRARSSGGDALLPMHLSVALAPGVVSSAGHLSDNVFNISPDGRWIVFPVIREGKRELFLRGIGQASGKPIDGTDGAEKAFFSPDSRWIAFYADGALKKLPLSGGSPISICTLSSTGGFSTGFLGASWGANDRIFFIPQFNAGIWTVPAGGGEPQLLLATDEAKDRIAYIYPHALPDNKGLLVSVVPNRARAADELDLAVLESGATEPRIIVRGGNNARYLASGHLTYTRGDAILAVAFDLSRLEIIGTPLPVIEGVERGPLGDVLYSVSGNGTLVYEPASGTYGRPTLVVVDRKGAVRSVANGPGILQELSASPDGRSVALRAAAQNDDVWTYDIGRGSPLRLTFEPGDEIFPQWAPDGTRIAFGSRVGKIFLKPTDGSGQREEISRGEFPRLPTSFSPDGKTLAFVELHPNRKRDILLLPLDGARKPEAFQVTDADEYGAKFSPDGRWMAYVSNESGRDDVYLRPIGKPGGRRRISSDGGTLPVWARGGRELFFLKGAQILAVTLDAQGNLTGGERVVLQQAKLNDLEFQADSPYYDVLPDGEHFVMLLSPKYLSPTHYDLVINWFEEIRQKVPGH